MDRRPSPFALSEDAPWTARVWLPWVLVVGFAVTGGVQWQDRTQLKGEIVALQQKDDVARMKITSLNATLDSYKQAVAVVVWDPEKQKGVVHLTQLPAAGADKIYQLWAIDAQSTAPVSAGVFSVGPEGSGDVVIKTAVPVGGAAKFAISVEPTGGSPSPRGPVVLIGP